jgi:hypothetical protein
MNLWEIGDRRWLILAGVYLIFGVFVLGFTVLRIKLSIRRGWAGWEADFLARDLYKWIAGAILFGAIALVTYFEQVAFQNSYWWFYGAGLLVMIGRWLQIARLLYALEFGHTLDS